MTLDGSIKLQIKKYMYTQRAGLMNLQMKTLQMIKSNTFALEFGEKFLSFWEGVKEENP